MKFLSVRDLKAKSSQVWKDLSTQKEMIVTNISICQGEERRCIYSVSIY
jgi:hypothetical protein